MPRPVAIILTLFAILGLSDKVQGQADRLFGQHEIDSLNYYYTPLYPTCPDDIGHPTDYRYMNVYYFNGECSICLNKMLEAETFFQEHENEYLKTFFIVETSDTIMFNYYRDKLNPS